VNSTRRKTSCGRSADLNAAERVIGNCDHIVVQSAEIETAAYRLLALQSPVAADLRAVVCSMQNAVDADRMGALALHIAEVARRRHPRAAVPVEASCVIAEMSAIAVKISCAAKDVVASGDPAEAARLCCDDDKMDELHRDLFTVVMDQNWSHGSAALVDITLLSRYYERFADHAVDIGRRVAFQRTGRRLWSQRAVQTNLRVAWPAKAWSSDNTRFSPKFPLVGRV
jgi:phosphate transport system protein